MCPQKLHQMCKSPNCKGFIFRIVYFLKLLDTTRILQIEKWHIDLAREAYFASDLFRWMPDRITSPARPLSPVIHYVFFICNIPRMINDSPQLSCFPIHIPICIDERACHINYDKQENGCGIADPGVHLAVFPGVIMLSWIILIGCRGQIGAF